MIQMMLINVLNIHNIIFIKILFSKYFDLCRCLWNINKHNVTLKMMDKCMIIQCLYM